MMPIFSFGPKEIINLLSKLKANTPDYPAEMFSARKAAFLKQVAAIQLQSGGPGGNGGQQAGGSGSALGGSSAAPGIAFQALIGLGLVTALLVGAYLNRNQEEEPSGDKTAAGLEEPSASTILPLTGGSATSAATALPSEGIPTMTVPAITVTVTVMAESSPIIDDLQDVLSGGDKTNPGLHLGEGDGTPAAPGQGNSGNINQPDKPDKPDKPNRPKKPGKPGD